MPAARRSLKGFTLVELLVVIGIIAILSALTIPAVLGMLRGSRLSTGSNALTSVLTIGRQYAMSRNCQVEIRLYQLPDATTPTSTTPSVYRAFQGFTVPNDGSADVAIAKPVFLPDQIIMETSAAVSTLLTPTGSSPVSVTPATGTSLGTYPSTSYNYITFHFKPDGSTDLNPSTQWFITLANQREPNKGTTGVPANFVTLQVNALSGRVTTYRPN